MCGAYPSVVDMASFLLPYPSGGNCCFVVDRRAAERANSLLIDVEVARRVGYMTKGSNLTGLLGIINSWR